MVIKTTKEQYHKRGEYIKRRKALHQGIVQKFISQKGHNPELIGLEAIILGGGSGAGKTSVLEDVIGEDGYVLVDADKIKEELREYRILKRQENPLASDIVHEESSDIATLLLNSTIEIPENLIYDGTMKNAEKYKPIIASLKANGYSVHIVVVDADVEVAVQRVLVRNGEGRFVSEEMVRVSNKLVSKSFLELKDLVDSYTIYENSINGVDPVEVAFKDPESEIEVIDQAAFDRFIAKSNL
ncbi:zeta toxin family protein [Bacillus safensis]|uniref:zeta toxin family protein n=1 Tax=Bacillus safensis TaxID=561879 RepID=UPI001FFBFA43|nr:zeta toxin family protein [Bacillus safensis]MCK1973268.1 zeta toxin family protein [Bacillus safensis]